MTPKEKALWLFNVFYHEVEEISPRSAKDAAIVCVDQILNLKIDGDQSMFYILQTYWHDVKQELIKIIA